MRLIREKWHGRKVFVLRWVELDADKVVRIGSVVVPYYEGEQPDELQMMRSLDQQIGEMREALHETAYDFETRDPIVLDSPLGEPVPSEESL
jgi:hypothetical protein